MRFQSQDRFLQYVASKRRTYLSTLLDRGDGRGFFGLWKGEWDFATGAFTIDGLSPGQSRALGRAARWLLQQDLVRVVRDVSPDFAPVPANVIEALPGALHQLRSVRSMLIAGERGSGREPLAILLHVLSGRPALLLRVAGEDLGRAPGAVRAAEFPERGSVLVAEIETTTPEGDGELLEFLSGEGRLRDLFVFSTTSVEPRELAGRFGLSRDLLMRTGQAEVRLAPLAGAVAHAHVDDLAFDLVQVPNDRLPALREEARDLAATWNSPGGRDLFDEAMTWLLWREKARLATATLADPGFARVRTEARARGTRDAMRARIAEHLGARARHDEGARGARAVVRPSVPPPATGGAAAFPPAGLRPGVPAGPIAESTVQPTAQAPASPTRPAPVTSTDEATPPVVPAAAAAPAIEAAIVVPTVAAPTRDPASADADPGSVGRTAVPTSMRRDDLLRAYYEALLDEESGDLRRVAARAGRKLRVLQAELDRLGVRPHRGLPLAPEKRSA
ncbi:hypothetical protein KGQ64_03990 [bacterium]|nr:hypothetical protein [bacterium]